MRKLLLPLILFFAIPFNTSCIKEITFIVDVVCKDCYYSKIKNKATFGHTYQIRLTPNEGYSLYLLDGVINVSTEKNGDITIFLDDKLYDENTDILTIPGNYINSKITIVANGQIE